MSEPREWWICWPLNPGLAWANTQEPNEHDRKELSQVIHVIEYSAYEKLQLENIDLQEKLGEWIDDCKHVHTTADETIAELEMEQARLKDMSENLSRALKDILAVKAPTGLVGAMGIATIGEKLLWEKDRIRELANAALGSVK